MLVSDIWQEIIESTGLSDDAVNYRAMTQGCLMLGNEGLFDPQIGYVDFYVDGGYLIALPRDVKAPLKLNIENNPTFSHNRLFEFALNSPGSVDGDEVNWQWHNRGYCVVQDERKLPANIQYVCVNPADKSATCHIYGVDLSGFERDEILVADTGSPIASVNTFAEVRKVVRDATAGECYLLNSASGESMARYYPDETFPEYRVIKLSKTGVAIRMLYRKNVFKIQAQTDIILFHSPMAVIQATKAARLMMVEQWDQAALAMAKAVELSKKEQSSRDETDSTIDAFQVTTAINANINTRDGFIVADSYDDACKIFGNVGRPQIFDKFTTAIEGLGNKGQFDSMVGWCDIWKVDNSNAINTNSTTKGNGFFVLPRYVESVLALTWNSLKTMPRNRWFEYSTGSHFHEKRNSDWHTWDDFGETVIVNQLPNDPTTRKPVGVYLSAVPVNALDDDTAIRVFGYDLQGNRIIGPDGADGVLVPCKLSGAVPAVGAPAFGRIERITKAVSTSFITLNAYTDATGTQNQLLIGYYYPDEVEPKYQMIRVQSPRQARVRIRYRRRWNKITSLNDPLPIRSRMALTTMLQAIKAREDSMGDPGKLQGAMILEAQALKYLLDDEYATNPTQAGSIQFDRGSSPFHNCNVQ